MTRSPCSHARSRSTAKAGFALPAVLTVVSVLTLVFITSIAALRSLNDETRAAMDAAEFERAALSAEAHAAYIVATEPYGQNRFRVGGDRISAMAEVGGAVVDPDPSKETPLLLDDHPYSWRTAEAEPIGEVRRYLVSLQDAAGLMNLNYSRRDALMRLFQKVGLSEVDEETLADEILDYIDVDSDRRLRGAEAQDYERAGRPAPPNAPINRLQDVFGVLDWPRIVEARQWRRMAAWLTADPGSVAFNVNTAPLEVLEVVLNMTEAEARAVMARRDASPINSLTQIGLPPGDETVTYTFPNGRVRFSFYDPARAEVYRSLLVLTPENLLRPLFVESPEISRLGADATTLLKNTDASPLPDPLNRPAHS